MYTTNLRVSDYNTRHYKVEINAAWITISDNSTGKLLAKRHADDGIWYDAIHQKVMKALHDLEAAIFEMVDNTSLIRID